MQRSKKKYWDTGLNEHFKLVPDQEKLDKEEALANRINQKQTHDHLKELSFCGLRKVS